jgi:hypothetical protein
MSTFHRHGAAFDLSEGVQKVAQLVWDTDTLSWVRYTGGAAGAPGAVEEPKSKRYDFASSTTLYIGESDPGTAESAAGWRIQRITFDAEGNPTQILYANAGASTASWTARASETYS